MNEIKRWRQKNTQWFESKEGKWVAYEDVAPLLANLTDTLGSAENRLNIYIAENAQLRDSLAEIERKTAGEMLALVYQAIGWSHADACVSLDNGEDYRKEEVPSILRRAEYDLDFAAIRERYGI